MASQIQQLSPGEIQELERSTGLSIVAAHTTVQSGDRLSDTVSFTTADHQHGSWNRNTGEHQINEEAMHWPSCRRLFPDGTF